MNGGIKARRQALDILKQAAPDNALANYLSAGNYFKSGQPEQAIEELQAGAAKLNFNDYTQDSIQSMTEAYMAAGYSEAEAKLAATTGAHRRGDSGRLSICVGDSRPAGCAGHDGDYWDAHVRVPG